MCTPIAGIPFGLFSVDRNLKWAHPNDEPRQDIERRGAGTGGRRGLADRRRVVAAVTHLCALGYGRIGVIEGPRGQPSSQERLAAATRALDGAGLGLAPDSVLVGDYTREGGARAAAALLTVPRERRRSAVLAATDQLVIGLLAGLRA